MSSYGIHLPRQAVGCMTSRGSSATTRDFTEGCVSGHLFRHTPSRKADDKCIARPIVPSHNTPVLTTNGLAPNEARSVAEFVSLIASEAQPNPTGALLGRLLRFRAKSSAAVGLRFVLAVVPIVLGVFACGGPGEVGVSQSNVGRSSPPELIQIVPAAGPAGEAYPLQAMLLGRGFMAAGNTVVFGPITIPDMPSTAGTRITFAVPKLMPSRGEGPPAVLSAGEYVVTVTTTAGTSNAMTFTLTRDSL